MTNEKRKVIVVDDDLYFLQHVKALLLDEGCEVVTANSLREAKKLIGENSDAYAVVLDIMMPSDGESDLETQMGYRTGLVLARWIREHYSAVKIIGISSGKSLDTSEWFAQHNMPFLEKGSEDFIEELLRILSHEERAQQVRTFIVHGHDEISKYDLKNYLQNTLKLPEPIILHEQPSLGRTIIGKFEDFARQVDLVFVLLTPDDRVYDGEASNDVKRRARQNVIFEMGYFLGKLQRKKARILLLHKGPLDLPSDISGIVYIDVSNGIGSAGELIRKELSFVL